MDHPGGFVTLPGMSAATIDEAPPTVRFHAAPSLAPSGEPADYLVRIIYREPGYAQKSGTNRSYSGRFIVRARSLQAALAEAKARFDVLAAQSGVGWIRVIESIGGRRLEPGESREGSFGELEPAGH
jgi:hypothetical protein